MIPNWLRFNRIADSPLLFGLVVSCLTWCVSITLQVWIIPYLFSDKGAVEGLVVLDSIGFHRKALEQADIIRQGGWLAWQSSNNKIDAPVAIASAMYVLFGSSPVSMLAFNALVHGLAATVVLLILRKLFDSLPAALGALAFAANPTSLEWVSQIHRDGIFVLGSVLFVLTLMNAFDICMIKNKPFLKSTIPSTIGPMLVGTVLVAMTRTYWLLVLSTTIFFITFIAFLYWAFFKRSSDLLRPPYIRSILLIFCTIALLLSVYVVFKDSGKVPTFFSSKQSQTISHTADAKISTMPEAREHFRDRWVNSTWLPFIVDSVFYNVFVFRTGGFEGRGNTIKDSDRPLNSAVTQILYIPRAVQLGFLSPFPDLWSGSGSTAAMTIARKVSGVITVIIYFFLITSIVGVYRLRQRMTVWVLVASCLIGVSAFALTYPNIGALIRFRYAYYMLLVAFGVATAATSIQRFFTKN